MDTLVLTLRAFIADEDGAAFIEYTALLGVILAVGIGILTLVGTWANTQWNTLCKSLGC